MDIIPSWVATVVGIANLIEIFSALAIIAIGIVAVLVLKQALAILQDVQSMIETEVRRDILPSVSGTLKNVRTISDDAAATTHNVTAAANRVSNLVGTAANKMESPLIRVVGIASGVLAGFRAVKGQKAEEPATKKRRGLFG